MSLAEFGLLSNPKAILLREPGISFPEGVMVYVHENMPTVLHLVLPIQEHSGIPQDLSDAELEQAIGGRSEPQNSDQSALAFGDTDHSA